MKLPVSRRAPLRFVLVYSSLATLTLSLTSCWLWPVDETCALMPCLETCVRECRSDAGPDACTAAVAECEAQFSRDAGDDAGSAVDADAGAEADSNGGAAADTDAGADAGPL